MARSSVLGGALLAGAVVLATGMARACDNDSDARRMEGVRPTDVMAVLSGSYVRHSPEWFAWRVRDRLQKVAGAEGPAVGDDARSSAALLPLLDDLAVAYDKLGRHEEAIAVARDALAMDGERYESLANLGTALAHAGRTEEALRLLRKAMEVNPRAHFGRARYEVAFLEYVEAHRRDGRVVLPLYDAGAPYAVGFPTFLARTRTPAGSTVEPLGAQELVAASTGVVGMMFSTRNDDPALLEVLAHLLVNPEMAWRALPTARLLAARAYLAAAQATSGPTREAYRRSAAAVLVAEGPNGVEAPLVPLDELEEQFVDERFVGAKYFERIRADEAGWMTSAPDPEAAFSARYLVAEAVRPPTDAWPRSQRSRRTAQAPEAPLFAAPAVVTRAAAAAPTLPSYFPYAIAGLLLAAGSVYFGTGQARRRPSPRRFRRFRR